MIEDITIKLLISLDLDRYVNWIMAHNQHIEEAIQQAPEDYKQAYKDAKSIPADQIENFPIWRKMSFDRERNRFFSICERSPSPIEFIKAKEFELMEQILDDFHSNNIQSIAHGWFVEDLYSLAGTCGVIDYLKYLNIVTKHPETAVDNKSGETRATNSPNDLDAYLTEDGKIFLDEISKNKNIKIRKPQELATLYKFLEKYEFFRIQLKARRILNDEIIKYFPEYKGRVNALAIQINNDAQIQELWVKLENAIESILKKRLRH